MFRFIIFNFIEFSYLVDISSQPGSSTNIANNNHSLCNKLHQTHTHLNRCTVNQHTEHTMALEKKSYQLTLFGSIINKEESIILQIVRFPGRTFV